MTVLVRLQSEVWGLNRLAAGWKGKDHPAGTVEQD